MSEPLRNAQREIAMRRFLGDDHRFVFWNGTPLPTLSGAPSEGRGTWPAFIVRFTNAPHVRRAENPSD